MRVSGHAPLLVGGSSEGAVVLLHARLWLVVKIDHWRQRRDGHLQLVRPADGATGDWRLVELADHPLRPLPAAGDDVRPPIEEEVRQWLSRAPLRFYRSPDLAVVSELGEDRETFRRRMLGLLRPELQRRIDELGGAPLPRLPWRRNREFDERQRKKERLAGEVSRVAGSIEQYTVGDPASCIRTMEIGVLHVAAGIELASPRHRDLMI